MKTSLSIAVFLAVTAVAFLPLDTKAQSAGNGGISMTIYPVVRGADGNQYLITPSGKHVTIPGLGIAQNATQVPVYRDQANHFWYTAMNEQNVAVTPQQLEAAQAQINAQGGGGAMPPQMMPPAQSYYNSTPTYAGGYNGIPYGTPVNMEGPGQYSYMAPGGNKQFVTPTPQMAPQFNQWQQQVPYGQQQMQGGQQQMQGGQQQMQGYPQGAQQGSAQKQGGDSRMDRRRDRRADRLEDRSKNQASNAYNDQQDADSKMQSGQTLGTGMESRRSAREQRRSNREQRRVDRIDGN